jgi:hypothetical protein
VFIKNRRKFFVFIFHFDNRKFKFFGPSWKMSASTIENLTSPGKCFPRTLTIEVILCICQKEIPRGKCYDWIFPSLKTEKL